MFFWPYWCQTTFAEAPDNETSNTTGHKYLEHLWLDKLRHRHQDISSPGCLPWLFSVQVFLVTSPQFSCKPLRQCAYRLWPAVHHDRRSGLWLKHTVALLTQTHQSCALKRFESCIAMAQSPTFAVQCKQHQLCAEYPCFDWHMQALLWLTGCIIFRGSDLGLAEGCSNTNHPPAHSLCFILTDALSALLWLSNGRCC